MSWARHQTACQLLCGTRSSLENIASLLGYSDATAFARWEGVPPALWLRRARAARGMDGAEDRYSETLLQT